MGLLDIISNMFGAVRNYFGWAKDRQTLNNSPEMQANAEAAVRQKIAEQAAKDVLDGSDLTQIRKDAAE